MLQHRQLREMGKEKVKVKYQVFKKRKKNDAKRNKTHVAHKKQYEHWCSLKRWQKLQKTSDFAANLM